MVKYIQWIKYKINSSKHYINKLKNICTFTYSLKNLWKDIFIEQSKKEADFIFINLLFIFFLLNKDFICSYLFSLLNMEHLILLILR